MSYFCTATIVTIGKKWEEKREEEEDESGSGSYADIETHFLFIVVKMCIDLVMCGFFLSSSFVDVCV